MKTIKETRGRKPTLSTVAFDTNRSGAMVVVVVLEFTLHSSQLSLRVKKTPTP